MEDLHRQAESLSFWEEEPEQIDLGSCCLIPFCGFERPYTDCRPSPLLGEKTYAESLDLTQAGRSPATRLLRQIQAYGTTTYYNKTMNLQTTSPNTASNKSQTKKYPAE